MNDDVFADVSRETLDQLHRFSTLVQKWTKKINLIAPGTVQDIWNRHFVDSGQIFQIAPQKWERWIDLGSGGGFPGAVIAIMDTKRRPLTLVESDRRKAQFLNAARRELDLNIDVQPVRIEHLETQKADVVSARALAPLPNLLSMAVPHLTPKGVCLFPKGRRYEEEVEASRKDWNFDLNIIPSTTSDEARILQISGISKRERQPNH